MRIHLAAAIIALSTPAHALEPSLSLDLIGEIALPADLSIDGHLFGGISGISYDATSDLYYAIGDDLEQPRFFTLKIDLADGALADGDVEILSAVLLNDND